MHFVKIYLILYINKILLFIFQKLNNLNIKDTFISENKIENIVYISFYAYLFLNK